MKMKIELIIVMHFFLLDVVNELRMNYLSRLSEEISLEFRFLYYGTNCLFARFFFSSSFKSHLDRDENQQTALFLQCVRIFCPDKNTNRLIRCY